MSDGISGSDVQIRDQKGLGRILAEVSNYHKHGDMYTHDNSLQVSLPNLDTPVVSTGWTTGDETGAGYVVQNAANGTITIGDKGAGRYQISGSMSFSTDKANIEIHGAFFVGGVKQEKFAFRRSIGNANDIGNACVLSGSLLLSAGDVIDLRFESDTNTTLLDIEHGSWGILWIAGE